MERTGAPDIFSLLRIYPLGWSGHVCRMEDGQLPKDMLYGQLPSAPRPVGRRKLRYKDVLKRDLKALDINTVNWEQLTLERASWRSLLQDRRAFGFTCTSQTAIVAELIVGHNGKAIERVVQLSVKPQHAGGDCWSQKLSLKTSLKFVTARSANLVDLDEISQLGSMSWNSIFV